MPIYEYSCGSCQHRFERFYQSVAAGMEQRSLACPDCADGVAARVISAVAFIQPGTAGVGRAAYPTSWEQANRGDRETIHYWQRRVERERAEEAKHPELAGVREKAAAERWHRAQSPATAAAGAAAAPGSAPAAADWRRIPYIDPGPRAQAAAGHGHSHPHPHPHQPVTTSPPAGDKATAAPTTSAP